MVHFCSVAGCKNNSIKNKNCSFFAFPKDTHCRAVWIAACAKKIKYLNTAKVCSAHFPPETFKPLSAGLQFVNKTLKTTPRKKLYSHAIPTENIPMKLQNLNGSSKSVSEKEDGEASSEPINIANNITTDEGSPEATCETTKGSSNSKTVLDTVFSRMPKFHFNSEEEKNCCIDELRKMNEEIYEKIANEIENLKKRHEEETEILRWENEKLKEDKRKLSELYKRKYLELKRREAYWRRECYIHKSKFKRMWKSSILPKEKKRS